MQLIVGAYAAAPPETPWDPAAEAAYLAGVATIPGVRGLEVPFTGRLHHDEGWLLRRLDPAWDLVVTGIPGTVARNATDPGFGLASPDEDGRRAALEFTADLRTAVRRVHDHLGRRAVVAVELHSAPTARGTVAAFAASLRQIREWDWDGAALTVEHCDAPRPGQPPCKGYLDLADEMSAADGIAGITVNWGRSAIEGRAADTARQHIERAAGAGALTGLMFSGAAAVPGPYGEAWSDTHLPVRAVEPTSLLGPAEIELALRAAGDRQLFTGVKIGVRPRDASVDQRIACLRDAVTTIGRIGLRL